MLSWIYIEMNETAAQPLGPAEVLILSKSFSKVNSALRNTWPHLQKKNIYINICVCRCVTAISH